MPKAVFQKKDCHIRVCVYCLRKVWFPRHWYSIEASCPDCQLVMEHGKHNKVKLVTEEELLEVREEAYARGCLTRKMTEEERKKYLPN